MTVAATARQLDDEGKLTDAEKKQLDRNHARAVRLALQAEANAGELVGAAADDAVRRLVDATTGLPEDERQARRFTYAAIAAGALFLQQGAGQANRSSRRQARELARAGVGAELRPVARYLERRTGVAQDLTPAPAPDTFEIDGASSDAGARTLANRFNGLAIAAFLQWRRSKEPVSALPARLKAIRDKLEPQVRFQSRNHAFDAFNDEKRGSMRATLLREPSSGFKVKGRRAEALQLRDTDVMRKTPGLVGIFPTGPEQGLPYGWGAVLFEAWSAILDRATCTPAQRTPNCWELDGSMVPFGKEFPGAGRPQLHLGCRCLLVSIFVPRLLEKRLPGAQIDFTALKDDVKAHMMASKDNLGEGVRHAERFLRPVLSGKLTSPEALVRAFDAGPRSYFPNQARLVTARAPRLPRAVTTRSSERGMPSPAPKPPKTGSGGAAPAAPKPVAGGTGATPPKRPPSPTTAPAAKPPPSPLLAKDFTVREPDVVHAKIQELFGRELTHQDVRELLSVEGALTGRRVQAQSYGVRVVGDGRLRIDYTVRVDGKDIEMTRSFYRDRGRLKVYHDFFFIDDALQDSGIGKATIAQQFRRYLDLGVSYVSLTPVRVGKYYWPSLGYRLKDPAELHRLKSAFSTYLGRKGMSPEAVRAVVDPIESVHKLSRVKVSGLGFDEDKAGKAFLLQCDGVPALELDIGHGEPGFEITKKRLGL